jgi:hypothetical protein
LSYFERENTFIVAWLLFAKKITCHKSAIFSKSEGTSFVGFLPLYPFTSIPLGVIAPPSCDTCNELQSVVHFLVNYSK